MKKSGISPKQRWRVPWPCSEVTSRRTRSNTERAEIYDSCGACTVLSCCCKRSTSFFGKVGCAAPSLSTTLRFKDNTLAILRVSNVTFRAYGLYTTEF